MTIALPALSWGTWALLVPVGIVCAFVVLLFLVALVETMPLSPFGGDALAVDPAQVPPYLNAMNVAAGRHGFVYGGTFRHVKGGTYQVLATFWFSPDRRTVLQVTGGTMARMPSRTSVMTSDTTDGRLIVTRDEVGMTDLSGIADVEAVVHADFEELWSTHAARLRALGDQVRPFEQAAPREAELEADRRRATAMVERGVARWTDASRAAYRYTLRGALRISTTQFFGQFFKHRTQSDRFSRPRPGDRAPQGAFPAGPATPANPATPAAPALPLASPPPSPPPFPSRPLRSERDFLH